MNDSPKTPLGRRAYRSLIAVAVLVLLGLLATAGVKSYRDLAEVRAHEAGLERRIEESESRVRVLRDYVRRIEEDSLTLERLAREELGLVKPGDVVIVLPEDPEPQEAKADHEDRREPPGIDR